VWPFCRAAAAPGSSRGADNTCALPPLLAQAFALRLLRELLDPHDLRQIRVVDRAARAFVDTHVEALQVAGARQLRALNSAAARGRLPALRELTFATRVYSNCYDVPDGAEQLAASIEEVAALGDALQCLTSLTHLQLLLPEGNPSLHPATTALAQLQGLRRLVVVRDSEDCAFLAAAAQLPALEVLASSDTGGDIFATDTVLRRATRPWLQLKVRVRARLGQTHASWYGGSLSGPPHSSP
jgi:hypothetical protein